MLLSKQVEIKWAKVSKKYYETKGYIFTNYGDQFVVKIEDVQQGSTIQVEVKCDYCGEIIKRQLNQHNNQRKKSEKDACVKCRFLKQNEVYLLNDDRTSFYEWCIQNDHKDYLLKWDYEKNNLSPKDVLCYSNKKYYFKCLNDATHRSAFINLTSLINNKNGLSRCIDCDSFYTWCIKNNQQDLLNRWDYNKNKKSPKNVYKGTLKKYYFKCPNNIHESELFALNAIKIDTGFKCRKCNSFAQFLIDTHGNNALINYWDKANKASPWNIDKRSTRTVFLKCKKHGTYTIICDNYFVRQRCPECSREKDESYLQEAVREYLTTTLRYNLNHETMCSICPKNPVSNWRLKYDNEVINLKLIIEVHGMQHYRLCYFHTLQAKINGTSSREEFEYQKWKDKYKKDYALSHGYHYLEIPYWTEKDESFKRLIDDKIKEILHLESSHNSLLL